MKKVLSIAMIALLAIAAALPAYAQQTKWATGTTAAAITVGADIYAKHAVGPICAFTDKVGGAVKFYTQSQKVFPFAVPTNGTFVVSITNTSFDVAAGFTTNDIVVYQHVNGTVDRTTVAGATSNSITLTAALTAAGAAGDAVYELTQSGQVLVGLLGSGPGTNDVLNSGADVFVCPADSPLYMVLDGTAACQLQATIR